RSGRLFSHFAGLQLGHQTGVFFHRIELRGIAKLATAVRLTYRQQLGNTELPGRTQDRQAVIDKQGALGTELHFGTQRVPEGLLLLGVAEVVGADQALEPVTQLHPLHLQRQGITVGVGNEDDLTTTALQRLEEQVRIRPQLDEVRHLALELDDRQIQLPGPEVQTIPVHLPLDPVHQWMDALLRPFQRLPVPGRIATGQILDPEMVVEMQIQQGAIHVQQDGIDGIPVQHGVWVLNEWTAMITNQPVTTEPACRRSQRSSMPASSPEAACSMSSRCSCVSAMVPSAPTRDWSAPARAMAR